MDCQHAERQKHFVAFKNVRRDKAFARIQLIVGEKQARSGRNKASGAGFIKLLPTF